MCPTTVLPPESSSVIGLLLPSTSPLCHSLPGFSEKELMFSQESSEVQQPVVLLEGGDLTLSPTSITSSQSNMQDSPLVPIRTMRRGHTLPSAQTVVPSIMLTYSADDSFYLKRLARKSRRSRLAVSSSLPTSSKKACLPSTIPSPLSGPSDVEHNQYGKSQIRMKPTLQGIHSSPGSPSRSPVSLKTTIPPNASKPSSRRFINPQSLGIALSLPILILILHLYFFLTDTTAIRQGHDFTFATPLATRAHHASGLRSHNQAWSRFGEVVNLARHSGSDLESESSIWFMQHSDDDDDDD